MPAPLKASGWWNYKIPPMLAVAYYAVAAAPAMPPLSSIWSKLLLYIVATTGIAGFGHFYLDIFDVAEDRLLGKSNLWAPLGNTQRGAMIVVLLGMSLIPWFFLPLGRLGWALLALEFLMFFAYATPPVRLKERGFLGIVADAFYAHVLPALWTWVPFSRLVRSSAPDWIPILIAAWAMVVGMRHLLQHQVIQIESDTVAHAATAAVRRGRERTLSIVVRRLLPFEFVLFAALSVTIGFRAPLVPAGFAMFVMWQAFKTRFIWLGQFSVFGKADDADRATILGTLILSRFYERWLPVLILVALSMRDRSYLILLAIHLAVFHDGIAELVRIDSSLAISYVKSRFVRPSQIDSHSVA